jgi:hypothetical protein
MSKNCLAKSVINQTTLKTSDKRPTQTYVGLTENEFKTQYTNHKASFNNYEKRNSTKLRILTTITSFLTYFYSNFMPE